MFRSKLIYLVISAAVMLVYLAFDFHQTTGSRNVVTSTDSSAIQRETTLPMIARTETENNTAKAKIITASGNMKDSAAVSALILALKDKNKNTQKRAMVALVQMKTPEAINTLIEAFVGSNSNLRRNLVEILSAIGTPAVPTLLVAVKSKYASVRSGAANVLGKIGDTRATLPLVAALEDKDSNVLRQAARALAAIKDPQSIEPLMALLPHKDARVRSSATYALGPLANNRHFDQMIFLLKDKNRKVREYAARALGIIKDQRAIAPLFVLMQDSNKGVKDAALSALTKMGTAAAPVALDMLKKSDRRNRTWAIQFLIAHSPTSVEPLVASLRYHYFPEKGPMDVQAARVIEAIQKAGDAAIDPLLIALKDDDPQTRISAAIVSGKIGNDRLAKPLMEATRDENPEVRRLAIMALGKIKGDEVFSFLIDALSHKDKTLRDNAVKSLGKRGDPRAVEPLIAYMERNAVFDKSKPIRNEKRIIRSVMIVLGDLKDTRAIAPLIKSFTYHMPHFTSVEVLAEFGSAAVEPLIAALRHDNRIVRRKAAETLGFIQDIRAEASLIASLKDSDTKVRRSAAKALGGLRGLNVVTALISALKDESSGVRWEAIRALKTSDDPRRIDSLITLLKDKSVEVRYQAGDVLAEIKSPRALKPLIAALKDKSYKVRTVAAQGLGLLGDSFAVKPLYANLTDWPSMTAVGSSLIKLGWRPQTVEDKIHLLIAQQDGRKLRSTAVWPDTKKVLLRDLASGHSTKLHSFAMHSLVAIGKKETFPMLIKKLWEPKKMPGIVSLFLNSGHGPLTAAAGKWAKRNGYRIHRITLPSTNNRRRSGWAR